MDAQREGLFTTKREARTFDVFDTRYPKLIKIYVWHSTVVYVLIIFSVQRTSYFMGWKALERFHITREIEIRKNRHYKTLAFYGLICTIYQKLFNFVSRAL